MVRTASRLTVVLALLIASVQAAPAQTAEEIIEKSVAALGGRAAHAKIKTRAAAGTITLQTPGGDIPGTIEIWNALPNKTRTLIKADLSQFGAGPLEVDQRFDGQNGYILNTLQGNREMTGNQLDNMRNTGFPHSFVTYKELGFTVKLAGKEKVGDREAYVLVFEPSTGSTIRQFVDAETFLLVRVALTVNIPEAGGDVAQTVDFSDYREVDGIKMPFRLSMSSAVQGFTVAVSKIEHNVAVEEKQFSKP